MSSLFPETVRDRLFKKVKGGKSGKKSKDKRNNTFEPAKSKMRNFLSSDRSHDSGGSLGDLDMMDAEARDRPIADLFPETTILFADIAGFTAWSSVREPSQVFTLLEKIYAGFDRIAIRRGVFKVETIGDSYVAVVGLPGTLPALRQTFELLSQMNALTLSLLRTSSGPRRSHGEVCRPVP